MRSSMKVTGLRETVVAFRSLGERVPNAARGQMHRSAAVIVEEAKLNTPVDDHLLEKSIRILKSYGMRGRLQIDIVAGGQMVINPDGREINLDQYAWIIHENYESYTPGKKTLAKMAANPGRLIGSGFLTRAVEDQEPKLMRAMVTVINDTLREVMG